jgi:hypothetical protein
VINYQENVFIGAGHLFVMVRTATLNWEIPIGVPGLGVFLGVFRHHGHVGETFECLSKFKGMLEDTGLFKSTKSVPMAGLYGYFLENPDWHTAACITMRNRWLTDHQNELPGEEHSGPQQTAMIYVPGDCSWVGLYDIKVIPANSECFIHFTCVLYLISLVIDYITRFNQVYITW